MNTATMISIMHKASAWVRASRPRIILTSCVTAATFILVLYFSLRSSYSLNPAVTHSIFTIPQTATSYVEILDPKEFYASFEKSAFGKSIIDSKAWEKLSGTPEFQKVSNLLYFVELKAGTIITYKDLPSFFGGSVGVARMKDDSMLIVAKTNLKSRLGLSLVKAFKGENLPLSQISPKKEGDKAAHAKKLEGVTADSYTDIFNETSVTFANLTVTRINSADGFIYLTMLDDYLFVSDSDATLKEALYLAAKPESSSLRSIKGMKEAVTAFEKSGSILIYLNAESSSLAPLLSNVVPGDSAAIVITADDTHTLTGDIFATGYEPKNSAPAQGTSWEKIIPQDQTIAVYSSVRGVNEAIERISAFPSLKELYEGSSSFFSAAGIDRKEYFAHKNGSALVLHGVELFNKKLYPQFAVGYEATKKDTTIMHAMFKGKKDNSQNYQGTSYTTLSGTEGGFYKPAFFYGAAGIVSSSRLNLEKYISASKGNRGVLADDASFAALGEYAKAPNHIVISIPRAIEALRTFYLYGAQRTGAYTAATIDRDIIPLTDPIKKYETLHI
ncbi:MAG TPA: hypothetical protein VF857_03065, partial [Spirochaetota bacterium]